jgi:hypothetical protein
MNLVNLTPHPIVVQTSDDPESQVTIAPSGTVARVGTTTEDGVVVISSPDNMFASKYVPVGDTVVPVHKVLFNAVEGLPSPAYDTIYIVSAMVAQQVSNRGDVVAPDTGASAVRKNGNVVAVRGFVRY